MCRFPGRAPWRWRSRRDDSLFLALRFDESQPQFVENGFEQLPLFGAEIAAGFFFEQRKNIDHLPRSLQVDGARLGLSRLEAIAEMDGRGRGQRQHERRKIDVGIRHKNRMVALKPMATIGTQFEKLVDVMRTLRSPDGCPWDREQTLESLTPFVLEEAHEVVDAIERGDMTGLQEEIGDHIFEGVFLAQVAADAGLFGVEDSLRTVVEKLVRRHPHVFQEDGQVHDAASKSRAPSAESALAKWNARKQEERSGAGQSPSTLDGLPKGLPSLLRAFKIGTRVARVGFDWTASADVIAKIEEEVAELRDTIARDPDNTARAEEEMGDLLFAIANLSRKLGIEPETALRKANDKFTRRFEQLEGNFMDSGRNLEQATLDEMEAEWQRIKAAE